MAKRFVDTELDDQPWFTILSCRLKCVVQHLFRKCDNAGIWIPNYAIAASYIGESFTEQELLSIDGGNQFEKLDNGKIFVKGFCDFQYGKLNEDCRPHRPVIDKLKKYGLYERVLVGYSKGIETLKDKDKEQYKDKEKEKEGGAGEEKTYQQPYAENVVYPDAQKLLLANRLDFEQICMSSGKPESLGLYVLEKYHLWLLENAKYPRTKNQIYAGFKKWLMNEKSEIPPDRQTGYQKSAREIHDEKLLNSINGPNKSK